MWVKLKPLSNKGKNRIAQHGDVWLVIKDCGNHLILESSKATFKMGSQFSKGKRVVAKHFDPDFEILDINE